MEDICICVVVSVQRMPACKTDIKPYMMMMMMVMMMY